MKTHVAASLKSSKLLHNLKIVSYLQKNGSFSSYS